MGWIAHLAEGRIDWYLQPSEFILAPGDLVPGSHLYRQLSTSLPPIRPLPLLRFP